MKAKIPCTAFLCIRPNTIAVVTIANLSPYFLNGCITTARIANSSIIAGVIAVETKKRKSGSPDVGIETSPVEVRVMPIELKIAEIHEEM